MNGEKNDALFGYGKANEPLWAERTLTTPPVVTSHALLAGGRELVIRHAGENYRLRLTGNNRLILTK